MPNLQQGHAVLGACRQVANFGLTTEAIAYLHVKAQRLSALVAGVAADLEASAGGSSGPRRKECWLIVRHVPYIFAVHDCISDIASGMTVKCAAPTHGFDVSLRSRMHWTSLRQ